MQLFGFADASEAAYAAVVYARSTDQNGKIFVFLVASKTKVAKIHQLSLPRLELNAAVLLTDLMKQLMQSLFGRYVLRVDGSGDRFGVAIVASKKVENVHRQSHINDFGISST